MGSSSPKITEGPGPQKEAPDDVFVVGTTVKEQAKILFIEYGFTLKAIHEKIVGGGGKLSLSQLKKWSHEQKWKYIRNEYDQGYDEKRARASGQLQATRDNLDEQKVRSMYAKACEELMNATNNYLNLNLNTDANMVILTKDEIHSLSRTVKELAEVHFRSAGIPEIIATDPASNHEGIELYIGGEPSEGEERKIARPPDEEDEEEDDIGE